MIIYYTGKNSARNLNYLRVEKSLKGTENRLFILNTVYGVFMTDNMSCALKLNILFCVPPVLSFNIP